MEAFREPLSAADPVVWKLRQVPPEITWPTVKEVVRAYARDPSRQNARNVQAAILALRQQKEWRYRRHTMDSGS